ncbi:unnamed protein product [Rotaria magnacalcarata]|uniref:VWFA domain-containing protein n=3 Tax=Rotaria magnacalcarata TaxID=392030 RepID=A0A816SAT5_9BILA|nr:unnamed protein product [Rotaria magnacalcarata]
MFKTKFDAMVKVHVAVLMLLCTVVKGNPLRAFNNPLNGKTIDLFLVAEESNSQMSNLEFGLLKTALNNIAIETNPVGSSPYFGVYFFGATTQLHVVAPFKTSSASMVKTYLDQKQYTMTQSNPSTLVSALTLVESDCALHCRQSVPRVTVVLSTAPSSSAEVAVRQLENNRGMIVIFVGIGSGANAAVVNQLASHPARFYALRVGSMYELVLSAQHIGSVAADVPRLLSINQPLSISSTTSGVYYIVQLNTFPYVTMNDTIVMFASNCPNCQVFGSLSEPNPISENTVPNLNFRSFYAGAGFPNTLYYFRIPRNTARFFVSLRSNGMSAVSILFDIFTLPEMLST